jgi:hypothetical protein
LWWCFEIGDGLKEGRLECVGGKEKKEERKEKGELAELLGGEKGGRAG